MKILGHKFYDGKRETKLDEEQLDLVALKKAIPVNLIMSAFIVLVLYVAFRLV